MNSLSITEIGSEALIVAVMVASPILLTTCLNGGDDASWAELYRACRAELFAICGTTYDTPGEAAEKRWESIVYNNLPAYLFYTALNCIHSNELFDLLDADIFCLEMQLGSQ